MQKSEILGRCLNPSDVLKPDGPYSAKSCSQFQNRRYKCNLGGTLTHYLGMLAGFRPSTHDHSGRTCGVSEMVCCVDLALHTCHTKLAFLNFVTDDHWNHIQLTKQRGKSWTIGYKVVLNFTCTLDITVASFKSLFILYAI